MRRPDWWGAPAPQWHVELGGGEITLRSAAGDAVARKPYDGSGAVAGVLAPLLATYPGGAVQAWVDAAAARLYLLPWVESLTSRARWTTYAGSRFEQAFGEPATNWSIRVADDSAPRARLAAALPSSLIDALRVASGGRLTSVRIGLVEQLARLVVPERHFSGCVVHPGTDVATLLVLAQGELRRVRSRRFEVAEDLVVTARSEWAGAGIQGEAGNVAIAVPAEVVGTLGAALAAAVGAARVIALPALFG